MASQVEIVNLALQKFGSVTIQSITDATPPARYAAVLWDIIRDELLYSYPWNFAMKRVILDTPSATEPEFGFNYKFTLPADCLRVWELYDNESDWTVEGGELYTDADEVYVRYIARIEATGLFSPAFVTSLALRLAAELCTKIAENQRVRAALTEEFIMSIQQAYKLNAIEGQRPKNKHEKTLSEGYLKWQER